MKNQQRYLIAFCMMSFMTIPASAFNYDITFTGSGASTTVDSVIVQNLSKGTQVTVPGGMTLQLYDVPSSVNELNSIADLAFVYPNPMTGNATYTFTAKYAGNTQIAVFGLDGRKVTGLDADLQQGKNSFQLALPTGVFLVQATGNGFSYTTKTISLSMNTSEPKIYFSGNTTYTKPQRAPVSVVELQYTTGDQLLYKGYSGNNCTIVTDKPTGTKTTDFKFVECTDANGNHYAVVHIGTQTWMAENLKTTKYHNGEAISTTTPATKDISTEVEPKYQWAYDDTEYNANKYGRLYTWYAISDPRDIAPEGWHIPITAEWTVFEDYLITNGYNYDGTTTGNKIAKSLAANTDWKVFNLTGIIGDDLTKNNSSGFSALPGGYRNPVGAFSTNVTHAHWWCFNNFSTNTFGKYLFFGNENLDRNNYDKSFGLSVRCVKNNLPIITTRVAIFIENTNAISGGEITNEGNSAVTERGICYSTIQNPTIADKKTSDGSGIGLYASNLTDLLPSTKYFVRAYATCSKGTFYGNEVNFTTKQADANETITDIDGNVYHLVEIGTQKWMVENLKTTRYRNGDEIGTTIPADKDISSEATPKYQWAYNGDENNVSKFGRLYTWHTISDSRNIAPEGWHVASDAEWTVLYNYQKANGFNFDGTPTNGSIAKSLAAKTDWVTSIAINAIGNDLTKNNSSGFTAMPGGSRWVGGIFMDIGETGIWWSSTKKDINDALVRSLGSHNQTLLLGAAYNSSGLSVRCIKD